MVEEGATGGGQFDPVHIAADKLNADFIFKIADLATKGRLRRMQPSLGRERQAALFRDRDEIAKVPKLHMPSISPRHTPQLTKSFSQSPEGAR